MRRRLPTASALPRVWRCAASAVLPRVDEEGDEHAARGTAIHAYLDEANRLGRDEALARVPEELRALCAAIDLSILPTDRSSYASEVALAYDSGLGTGRELGRGIGRAYPELGPYELAGTADVLALGPDGVYVGDYKTGFGASVEPARTNKQLLFLALAAARAYGRTSAVVEVIRVREDGSAWRDAAAIDALDLDLFEGELREVVTRVLAARQDVETGRAPDVTRGPHCTRPRCPALRSCPAQTALVRHAVSGGLEAEWAAIRPITPEQAGEAYMRIRELEALLKSMREAIYACASEAPIPLPEGKVLGLVETTREHVVGEVARAVLERLYGAEVAAAACDYESSKAAIRRALRQVVAERGGKLAELERQVLAELEAAGGLERKTTMSVKERDAEGAAA